VTENHLSRSDALVDFVFQSLVCGIYQAPALRDDVFSNDVAWIESKIRADDAHDAGKVRQPLSDVHHEWTIASV
jgi:hypothetical protein